jgi:ribosomal protein S11
MMPLNMRRSSSRSSPGFHAQAAAQRHARQEAASGLAAFHAVVAACSAAIAKALGIGRASVYRVLEA